MGWEEKWVRLVFSDFAGRWGAAGVGWTRASCRFHCSLGEWGGWREGVCFQRKMGKCRGEWEGVSSVSRRQPIASLLGDSEILEIARGDKRIFARPQRIYCFLIPTAGRLILGA